MLLFFLEFGNFKTERFFDIELAVFDFFQDPLRIVFFKLVIFFLQAFVIVKNDHSAF